MYNYNLIESDIKIMKKIFSINKCRIEKRLLVLSDTVQNHNNICIDFESTKEKNANVNVLRK